MNKKLPKIILFNLFSLFLCIVPVCAEDSAEDISFRLGICYFEDLGAGSGSAADGVTAVFYETIKDLKEHKMTNSEIIYFLIDGKQQAIDAAYVSLEEMYTERDEIIFTESEDSWKEKFEDIDDEIETKKETIAELEEAIKNIPNDIKDDFFSFIEVDFKTPDNSLYFKKMGGDLNNTTEEYSLDGVVYGFIDSINNYNYLEVRFWNRFLQEDVVIWKTALNNDNINNQLREGQRRIKTAVLGKEWAELSINGPGNCMIYIDGNFSGIGQVSNLILPPGPVSIELRKQGCRACKEDITLKQYEHTELSYDLEMVTTRETVVQSFPGGADVYLDSKWIGKSPVVVSTEDEISAIMLKMDGYEDRVFFINEGSEDLIEVNLKRKSAGRDDWVPGCRKRFLNTFGMTLLSIPITAICYNLVLQSTEAFNREYSENGETNYSELLRLGRLNKIQYGLYACSLGLNVFLGLDTILKATEYVKSVDYFSK